VLGVVECCKGTECIACGCTGGGVAAAATAARAAAAAAAAAVVLPLT